MTSTGCLQRETLKLIFLLNNLTRHVDWKHCNACCEMSFSKAHLKHQRKQAEHTLRFLFMAFWSLLVQGLLINLSIVSLSLWGTRVNAALRDHEKSFLCHQYWPALDSLINVCCRKAELLLKNDNSQQRGDHIYRPSIRGLGCAQRLFCGPREQSSKDQRRPPTPRTGGRISASLGDQCAFIAMLPLSEPHEPLPLASRSIYLLLYLQ